MFKITDCIVRIAVQQDKADLIEISKGIWDGHDYLPNILDKWLAEPWFFVCEYHGKVISCLKLSVFPDNVLWFEGLRVHAKYQGNGIATLMNKETMRFALALKQQNPALKYEFCTYYKNVESLHVTNKLGFKPVEKFYNLDKRGVKRVEKPEILQDYPFSIFSAYPRYLPLNWHAVHSQEESLPFIKAHSEVFRTPEATYLIGTTGERCITFLSAPPKNIKSELPYFQYFYGSRKKISVILPRAYAKYIGHLQKHNFFFWDESRSRALNMLVLSI